MRFVFVRIALVVLTASGSTTDDCVNVLLDFRTLDVNCADLRLTTPLHWAAGLEISHTQNQITIHFNISVQQDRARPVPDITRGTS